ncbi:MAG TPA: FeoB-associated Cys-rich membrane protein [Tepidisphaeraceae bacterium]|nr:FeoB-associated Cys-rich membrane protein [Tepidisphaeraceae bacterium]
MPLWTQNIIVIAAVGACAAFMLRSAYRALHGRKSKLSGCGVCSGCATTPAKPKPSQERIAMVPMDALIRTRKR